MSTALAIFVKTPSLSPVKTRLAKTIGQKNAKELYDLCLIAMRELAHESGFNVYWAVAELDGIRDPLWQGFKVIHTGAGCLGQHQSTIYNNLLKGHQRVILIGADAPQITPETLHKAEHVLGKHDFVFGPARDGGYYLFGGTQPIQDDIWLSVPWSSAQTMKIFEANLNGNTAHLPTLSDVDEEGDLEIMLRDMPENLTKAQQDIQDWVKNLALDYGT